MQRVISLEPISVSSFSAERQKRIRAEQFSALPHHSLKSFPPPPQQVNISCDDENMPIHVSDNLH